MWPLPVWHLDGLAHDGANVDDELVARRVGRFLEDEQQHGGHLLGLADAGERLGRQHVEIEAVGHRGTNRTGVDRIDPDVRRPQFDRFIEGTTECIPRNTPVRLTSVATTLAPAATSPQTCCAPFLYPSTIPECSDRVHGRRSSGPENERRTLEWSRARLQRSGSRARTCDKLINSQLLCQLSYPGRSKREVTASMRAITRR